MIRSVATDTARAAAGPPARPAARQPTDVFTAALRQLLGDEHCLLERATLDEYQRNSLGLDRSIVGVVRPGSKAQVVALVRLASQHKVPLYPISRGRNLGYGDRLPAAEGQLVVDLQRLNRISDFDIYSGTVVVEPGVTQQQLYAYIRSRTNRYWTDATGAGLDASVLGNTLEGGFGHTPEGNHRASIDDVEVVLGNGTVFRSGSFPALGPDLAGIFVQSNFGVVLSLKVKLVPAPERYESFVVTLAHDDDLEPFIAALKRLRQQGVLKSLVHVANATRYLVSSKDCPASHATRTISNDEAREMLSSWAIKVGRWNAAGGLYGSKQQVKAAKSALKAAFRGFGKLRFFNELSLRVLQNLPCPSWLRQTPLGEELARIGARMREYRHFHELMRGVPTDMPLDKIAWRVSCKSDIGLIWCAPTTRATPESVRQLIEIAQEEFHHHGFELPITITPVTSERVVGILSISFDKSDRAQTARAQTLYSALMQRYARAGIHPYRGSVLSMAQLEHPEPGKGEVLQTLKQALDPEGIISPGRYGL